MVVIVLLFSCDVVSRAWHLILRTNGPVSRCAETFIQSFVFAIIDKRTFSFVLAGTYKISCALFACFYTDCTTWSLFRHCLAVILARAWCLTWDSHKGTTRGAVAHTNSRFADSIWISKVLTWARYNIFQLWRSFTVKMLFFLLCTLDTSRFEAKIIVTRTWYSRNTRLGSCW